jgi:hypothetical protein
VPPAITYCKFKTTHPDPNPSISGRLHNGAGTTTIGFLRGTGLDVGQVIMIFSKNGKKAWVGWVTEQFTDSDGAGWFFKVQCAKNLADADSDTTEVTVIMVDPTSPTAPGAPMTPVPNPDVVP